MRHKLDSNGVRGPVEVQIDVRAEWLVSLFDEVLNGIVANHRKADDTCVFVVIRIDVTFRWGNLKWLKMYSDVIGYREAKGKVKDLIKARKDKRFSYNFVKSLLTKLVAQDYKKEMESKYPPWSQELVVVHFQAGAEGDVRKVGSERV